MVWSFYFFILVLFASAFAHADSEICHELMKGSGVSKDLAQSVCPQLKSLDKCRSVEKRPIFHYEKKGNSKKGKKILALALIHGDEVPSASVAVSWIDRLGRINGRNTWRVLPIVSPDGLKSKTRTNKNGVDLNRNFPTQEWSKSALKLWKVKKKSDPRRYPGPSAASEPETKCLIEHFEDYQPDFIISIHTPLGVLDFDGPKISPPRFSPLRWTSLGHFPGSLGRYMWKDQKVPVLTIELKGNQGLRSLEKFDQLQDISGTVAIQSGRVLERSQKK